MNRLVLLFITLISLLSINKVAGQIVGCTDSNANNYNLNATINDGSCTYDPTFFQPSLKIILPAEIEEASGLIFYNGGIWTFNDSGGEAKIYKIDTLTGVIVQTISILNGQNIDWEDITQDVAYIYIGDFGNNYGNRDDLKLYKIAKSTIPQSGDLSVNAEIINFNYEDQYNLIKNNRANNFDCESVISFGDQLILFSKNWENQQCKLYTVSKMAGNHTATKINEFNTRGLITGAATNEQQNQVILVGYVKNTSGQTGKK